MDKKEIVMSLKELLSCYFNIKEKFKNENFDKELIGYFLLDYIDLVYLYILIEETFRIKIDSNKLKRYRFNTINGIIRIVEESK